MPKFIDLTSQRFGRLFVVSRSERGPRAFWNCKCDCGKEVVVAGTSLREGTTKSCGCLQRDTVRARATKHGHAPTKKRLPSPEYHSWRSMKFRCNNPKHSQYANYGGRGIKVCDRWEHSFVDFLADMGPRPEGTEIDRIDNSKNYEPGNCRWSTHTENCRHTRNSKMIELKGRSMCLSEWADETGIGWHTIYYRIKRGWSAEDALTRPVS